ncbi:Similar to Demethylmenaquinone methyltransferase; acc. no. Q9RRT0 [Pyronema omphalodes CBS 100304]|uniref:Similar to Demethylmenaquinone methyltransferase acc. no. Q9RRT0 n=1 Tax=Pyronema omphalodes (strain CBS 100304) TaxID=1076935 RepID=U4LEF6_PYROM|nr:Similar to Demethylmenaquinone methyltransferase; acc. no. Q9RRT0 [Pyronema omphalodes CBS 100304]
MPTDEKEQDRRFEVDDAMLEWTFQEVRIRPQLERPEGEDYDCSGYDTSTASLSSSVHQYLFAHLRRYHAYYGPDKYLMPTDEKEQDRYVYQRLETAAPFILYNPATIIDRRYRLDLHHEMMRLLWNDKLHESPLDKPHRILDIGTGIGMWAIVMADQYAMAEVIGTDLSPIQADCRFEVDNAMLEWTFKDESFDFIHARNISGVSHWDHLVSEMIRCTNPGGYVELCEYSIKLFCDDGTMNPIMA